MQPITEINETGTESFSVYPNPTIGDLTIKASNVGSLIIFTILGQQLIEYNFNKGQTEFQLPNNIASGVYIGKFKSANGQILKEVRLVYEP